ncbi:replication-relaxation family protein [Priestia aryabhattai]|uniref:Replication-relaxation family protein n=1 Tax=Priestia aryabhattai TaxID=412384 RepID=A0ABD7X2B1_PRIAR|nr:replication-relaxation family protein [Priestia aryabhattai]WEA46781.1 replication-relaxation family protein [Priestia aryabhattai]
MQKVAKKEQRIDNVLLSLKKLDFLSRSQIQTLHNLGSDRNAQKFLKSIDKYVHSFREGENVYYLSKEGRERVECNKVRKKTIQARHYLMRNSLYIAYGCPSTWENEVALEVEGYTKIICDANFEDNGRDHIIEVDYTQKMSVNKNKIEKYRILSQLGVFETPPMFIWMTTTEYRRKQLLKMCEGLDAQVFIITDFL